MTGPDPSRLRSVGCLLVVLALGVCWPLPADGHKFRPALLDLEARGDGAYAVTWKQSRRQLSNSSGPSLTPTFPEHCEQTSSVQRSRRLSSVVETWRIDCSESGLTEGRLHIDGLADRSVDVLVRFSPVEGTDSTTVLRAERPSLALSTFRAGEAEGHGIEGGVLKTYTVLGIEHILLGPDHLLFVAGLLLLVGWRRKLIYTITAFTLAHSLTLAGASLGLVDVPSDAVEASIALSILLLAMEVAREPDGAERDSLSARHPWALSFAFGLLHGFGFAGVLAEIGLPDEAIPTALLAFNVGVEVGQLMFVGLLGAVGWLLSRIPANGLGSICRRGRLALVYALGSLSAYWTIARTLRVVGLG